MVGHASCMTHPTGKAAKTVTLGHKMHNLYSIIGNIMIEGINRLSGKARPR